MLKTANLQRMQKLSKFITDKAFINGNFINVHSTFPVLNPFDNSFIGEAAKCNKDHAQKAIEVAKEAQVSWGNTCGKDRTKIMLRWMDLVLENQQLLTELITLENGKPLNQSLAEIMYTASCMEWCAEEAKRTYGMTIPTPMSNKRLVSIKQPIGVAGLITPWNFPCATITRKACAAIAAGCSVVLKPSDETPYSALALAQLSKEAGLPDGVFNVLPTSKDLTPGIGKLLCTHPDVGAISCTGSTNTGRTLLRDSADTVKKVSLELGGMSPFIVFNEADMDVAIQQAMISKFANSGQSCIASSRFFVQSNVHDQFVEKMTNAMNTELVMGDPTDPKVTLGPMISENGVKKVEAHIEDAIKRGGKIVTGGKRSEVGGGLFFEPTLITDTTSEMLCCKDETFGPVAPVMKFDTEEEAIAKANDCRYGLAGYIFSKDVKQCWRVAEKLDTGMVGINDAVLRLVEAPFGGVKESGLGREGSNQGLEEFMETKYMCWGV